MTQSYADTAKGILDNYILPKFGKMSMAHIRAYDIEKWLDAFAGKGLVNATANLALSIFKTMLNEAVRRNIIQINPSTSVARLKNTSKVRNIPSDSEVKALFDEEKKSEIWTDVIYYLGNLLAACTGMRISEILAVRGESLKGPYILVDSQYKIKYG